MNALTQDHSRSELELGLPCEHSNFHTSVDWHQNSHLLVRISINLQESINFKKACISDRQQLWRANENRTFWTRDACFTLRCTLAQLRSIPARCHMWVGFVVSSRPCSEVILYIFMQRDNCKFIAIKTIRLCKLNLHLVINTLGIMQMRLDKRLHVLQPITLLEATKGKDWQPTLPSIRVSRGWSS